MFVRVRFALTIQMLSQSECVENISILCSISNTMACSIPGKQNRTGKNEIRTFYLSARTAYMPGSASQETDPVDLAENCGSVQYVLLVQCTLYLISGF